MGVKGNGARDGPRLEGYGRLAGWLFISASVLTIPGAMLLEPPPPAGNYLLAGAGAATGIACFLVPWDRLGYPGFHALGVIAVAETAAAVELFGHLALYFYFLIAVFGAYVQPSLRRIAPHLALISIAMLLPAAYEPEETEWHLRFALFGIPIVTMAALMAVYLRAQLAEQIENYERLAGTTEQLARRIQDSASRALKSKAT
jgi:hypothetical protein